MASVHDVAAYVLAQQSPMTAMKLQKLVYYCQAWHLVWDEETLFDEPVQAWANGPVVYELYAGHRGLYTVQHPWRYGDPAALRPHERETVDAVLRNYGDRSARQLSHLTHNEDPWLDARGDLPSTASSTAEITPEAMIDYYGALDVDEDATPIDEMDWDAWERF